ncbi:GspH/FimT family pseudopilin [Piscinibacter sp.]|jgi:type IV fimbrial biogenesis protein FimT|uniref:GspH/FimT family pseudopilin n=1 Tax=Piscinibacter sp. TaxID=1903157 RepID=UPI002F42584A
MSRTNLRPSTARGFTLIELMVVVALTAVILSLAAPSFSNFLAKRRVEGVASELVTDLQYARSEAVQRNANVGVIVESSCYSVYVLGTTDATSCTSRGTGSVELKTVQLATGSATLVFTSNNSKAFIEFEPVRGMATNASSVDYSGYINVTGSSGSWTLRAVVTKIGRVKTCSPDSSMTGVSSDCT